MPLAAVHIQAQQGHAQARPQVQMPRMARLEFAWITSCIELPVYRRKMSAQQQIRAVTLRLFESRGAAPIRDFGVIAADQDVRDFPAAKVGGPRVVGKIQQKVIRETAVVLRRWAWEFDVSLNGRGVARPYGRNHLWYFRI